jgi:hypothetical protein
MDTDTGGEAAPEPLADVPVGALAARAAAEAAGTADLSEQPERANPTSTDKVQVAVKCRRKKFMTHDKSGL